MSRLNPVQDIELDQIPNILPLLSQPEQERLLAELDHLEKLRKNNKAQISFLSFVREVWPSFIAGRHHAKMAHAFERVARGELKRLIINMPPRHTKSEFASYLFPAWFLGKFPQKKVIQCSHTGELAVGFGRKVRNLVDTETYHSIFPDLVLAADSKAAGRWNTSKQGDYFAIGVGGAVTGKGADILIIDDPHSEQEAALAEINPEIYDKTYEWYTSGPRQRLQPGGAIVIVMCMTGDTRVLLADGHERFLRDIRPGDKVATYKEGQLKTSHVLNWKSNGHDSIWKITTSSGITVRANERHPFLVADSGELKWVRLKNLRPGQNMLRVTGGSGREKPASTQSAIKRSTAGDIAHHTITKSCGQVEPDSPPAAKKNAAMPALSTDTTLLAKPTTCLSRSKVENVQYATSYPERMSGHIGAESFVSIIATKPEKSGGSCAMTVTSLLGTQKHQKLQWPQLVTSDFTLDEIISITPDGVEEVFDLQVAETENFIANGVVSHNTRWSKKDLTGRVLQAEAARGGEGWEVIEFPAILPSGNPLWPEFWSLDELDNLKEELPNSKWMAQYQQNPTSEQSAIVKREWWQVWEKEDPPKCQFILTSWDTAFEKSQRADYSAMTTWGVFYQADEATGKEQANIILLNAVRERAEFPRLKQLVLEQYKSWKPDGIIIEKKASGAPLIYEMRAMGIPVQEFTPVKGNDKISRLNAVSDLFASGRVWMPGTHWAEEVRDEVAEFPSGDHDDYVDSVSMALLRFRKGGYIRAELDEEDAPKQMRRRFEGYY